MTLLIPRTDEALHFKRIAAALLTTDQFDDWLPDPVYYQDQCDEMEKIVSRVRTLWDAESIPPPEVEVLDLPRRSGAHVPALALALDTRVCAHAVIALMAQRVRKSLPRDKVYGFRFLQAGHRVFDPPGRELEHVFDLVGSAAQAAASGTFEVLDVVAFNSSAKSERLVTTLQRCGARQDECNFLRDITALAGGGLPSIDDAFAFAYNFYLQPVDVTLMEQRHNFFRYRDEYFVFDDQAKNAVVEGAKVLNLQVRPIGSRNVEEAEQDMKHAVSTATPTAEQALVRLPYGTFSATVSCSSFDEESCSDYSEITFRVSNPPLKVLFAEPVVTPLDSVQVLPHLRRVNERRQHGVLLGPPFAGETDDMAKYRTDLAAGRHWLGHALETAVRTGSSWQAGWTATLLSDIGMLAERETGLMLRALGSPAMGEAAKMQIRVALARSSRLAAARFWTSAPGDTEYRRRAMLVGSRHLARRDLGPWNASRQASGAREPELVRHLIANIRVPS